MFEVAFQELLLVFVIGLLILGPERLPRVAAQLGRWVAKARRTANQLRYQLEREVALDEIYKAQKKKPQKRPGATAPGTPAGEATDAPAAETSAASATETTDSVTEGPAEQSAADASVAESPDATAARHADSSAGSPSPTASDRLEVATEVATEEAVENAEDAGRFRQSESSR